MNYLTQSSDPTTPAASATGATSAPPAGESRSGETLLVQGYIFIWVALMAWLFFLWRKQAALHGRIDELEKAIAAAAKTPAEKGAAPRASAK